MDVFLTRISKEEIKISHSSDNGDCLVSRSFFTLSLLSFPLFPWSFFPLPSACLQSPCLYIISSKSRSYRQRYKQKMGVSCWNSEFWHLFAVWLWESFLTSLDWFILVPKWSDWTQYIPGLFSSSKFCGFKIYLLWVLSILTNLQSAQTEHFYIFCILKNTIKN